MDRGDYDQLLRCQHILRSSGLGQPTRYFWATLLRKEITSNAAAESRPEVGSSKKSRRGPVTNCAATLTRRFWPPDTTFFMAVPTRSFVRSDKPKAARSVFMRVRRSVLLVNGVERRAAKSSVSLTVKEPIRASSCSTYAQTRRNCCATTGTPFRQSKPSVDTVGQ